jgi:hypothetical protein
MESSARDVLSKLPDRIAAKIMTEHADGTGCWLWMGARVRNGYGSCWFRQCARQAHRVVWTLLCGEIEPNHTLDHVCRVRHCVNPAHLEPVSQGENNRRSTCWHHPAFQERMGGHP